MTTRRVCGRYFGWVCTRREFGLPDGITVGGGLNIGWPARIVGGRVNRLAGWTTSGQPIVGIGIVVGPVLGMTVLHIFTLGMGARVSNGTQHIGTLWLQLLYSTVFLSSTSLSSFSSARIAKRLLSHVTHWWIRGNRQMVWWPPLEVRQLPPSEVWQPPPSEDWFSS
jgi:hypothetical protein